jgi:hypothetical protein
MLYFLVPAMYPRFLITLDENLEPKPVTVRVGTVGFTYEGVILYLTPFSGCRCCGTSGQAAHNLWLPNLSDTCTTGNHRTCGARNGRIHPICERVGGVRLAAEEPRLGGEDGVVICIDTMLLMYFHHF